MKKLSMQSSLIGFVILVLTMTGNNCFSAELSTANDVDRRIKQATNGDASSALWLSRYYEKKDGAEKEARQWLLAAAKLGSVVAIVELGYEKPYIAETDFKCGSYKIHISTSCSSIDKTEGQPICYTQHFEFSLGKENKDFFLFNPDFRTDLMIATQATCIADGSHHWLVIESSNFGSGRTCVDCEREDYFDESTRYIGSSPSRRGSKIVLGYRQSPKVIENKLQVLMQDSNTIKQVFEINRYPVINGDYAK